ncbi:hypothetical protein [Quadrisphaera setariae]|uniref:Uncharacterized protein n=1 Tax=Quadrisphaera setariae TaxID=2593304 RepID=A0A5C8ZJ47_9ACTN|nr:hypothetical protein [Quadrisphaera setariae]TXR56946.1 hypothetical protein FMM08_05445 [Quadrisphaera setariae]
MVAINRVARVVLVLALLWSLVALLAAVNWHVNWTTLQRAGGGGSDFAVHAQERWQLWVDLTLVGVVVAVLALVGAVWPLVRSAGALAQRRGEADADLEIDLRGPAGFGGGSEEVRRHAGESDAR